MFADVFRNGGADICPYRTKSKCRQVVNLDVNRHIRNNVTFPHKSPEENKQSFGIHLTVSWQHHSYAVTTWTPSLSCTQIHDTTSRVPFNGSIRSSKTTNALVVWHNQHCVQDASWPQLDKTWMSDFFNIYLLSSYLDIFVISHFDLPLIQTYCVRVCGVTAWFSAATLPQRVSRASPAWRLLHVTWRFGVSPIFTATRSALSGPVRTGIQYPHFWILPFGVPGLFTAYRDLSQAPSTLSCPLCISVSFGDSLH